MEQKINPILSVWEFYFPDRNIRQVKNLISHAVYKEANKIKDDDEHKRYMKRFGEWFTDNSPYFKAIGTGAYTVINCGTTYSWPVIATQLN